MKATHVAFDYRFGERELQSVYGKTTAQGMRTSKTKTLCGAEVNDQYALGLDDLCSVTCVLCLKVVAREGKSRSVGGMKRKIVKRPGGMPYGKR